MMRTVFRIFATVFGVCAALTLFNSRTIMLAATAPDYDIIRAFLVLALVGAVSLLTIATAMVANLWKD